MFGENRPKREPKGGERLNKQELGDEYSEDSLFDDGGGLYGGFDDLKGSYGLEDDEIYDEDYDEDFDSGYDDEDSY
ncbi:MAG: hypothetical protein LBV08_07200 [Clostridiales bacterium]|jgi:hypothetical protein|nr:hypothetical protein [Clostridiales bacterium]